MKEMWKKHGIEKLTEKTAVWMLKTTLGNEVDFPPMLHFRINLYNFIKVLMLRLHSVVWFIVPGPTSLSETLGEVMLRSTLLGDS